MMYRLTARWGLGPAARAPAMRPAAPARVSETEVPIPSASNCLPGRPAPLGAQVEAGAVNFAVYSPQATAMELVLFAEPAAPAPALVVALDPTRNRTGPYWHVAVPGIGHGQAYGWRATGPRDPARGLLFDGDKLLLDPSARAVTGHLIYDRRAAAAAGDNTARALRSVVVDPTLYDWEGDTPLPRPPGREVIYELHVRGFTAHASSDVPAAQRGTYAGLAARAGYLRSLGITAVELMPVHEFDPQDGPPGLANVWGYSPVAWSAPHAAYSSDRTPTGPVDEFRDMVKALHRAGVRVIIDVVYNHTAEGGPDGPILSWRGFDNRAYYIAGADRARYADFTGCGNTISANHPVTSRLIVDSLRWWVKHLHVDGFRFDLASTHTRGEDGVPLERPPVLWAISTDPELAGTALIAEAWDTGGLYQVGDFPGGRFGVWNGRFRDDVRRYWRGDEGTIESLMARLVGSPDLLRGAEAKPSHSINFATCHDGFCLRDLVSYDRKHNTANGEGNRDGTDDNLSWNCGSEGPTDDPVVAALRARQVRNFTALTLLAHGTPMLLAGDEFGHTRLGNNNPWCQDNAFNHLDWSPEAQDAGLLRFTRGLIAFTSSLRILQEDRYWAATSPGHPGDISWHGVETARPDWSPRSRALAFTLEHGSGSQLVHVMTNAGPQALDFNLPPASGDAGWRLVVDTARPSPADYHEPGSEPAVAAATVRVAPHSLVVLIARRATA
jgi:isoamylase